MTSLPLRNDVLFGVWSWLSTEENPVVGVRSFTVLLNLLFQGWKPTLYQVNVLKDCPVALCKPILQKWITNIKLNNVTF